VAEWEETIVVIDGLVQPIMQPVCSPRREQITKGARRKGMDAEERKVIGKAGQRLEKDGQIKGRLHGWGGHCSVGAIQKVATTSGQAGRAVSALDGWCQKKWGLDTIAANDSGKLKPHHFQEIAGGGRAGGVRRKKAEAAAQKERDKKAAEARKRPGGSGKQKPCEKEAVPGPSKVSKTRPNKGSTMCEPASSGGSRGVGVLLALGGVAVAVAVSFIATHAAAINLVLTWLAVALVVAVVARPLWSLRDQINWGYIPVWWQHRQQHRQQRRAIEATNVASLDAKRAEWQERVRQDSQPIALPSSRPSPMHEAIVRDWVEAPSRHVR
jgi:hypothetical protein